MPLVSTNQLINLQSKVENIRNICILAHVDHGKTTLSDSLLASNGIISTKLAGKVRYLDSREDEQERGITMEASGISLYFNVLRKFLEGQESSDDYLINLIDAPGHVDFSSEVSTASRLCDGALVLVDVVEGACTQTHTVLRQAWFEHVRPVLVLNKIDRLITELKLTPHEAYIHLNKILEQVNAIMGTFYAGDIMEEETRRHEAEKEKLLQQGNEQTEVNNDVAELSLEDHDDSNIYFTPDSGNVVFASAIDGWAFSDNPIWLEHKHLKGRQLKPLFVQLVLENIWSVYDSIIINNNREKIEKIVKALNLKILPRDMRSKDTRNLLTTVFTQWLPLSSAVLLAVIDQLPSPIVAQPVRLPKMLYPNKDVPEKPANEVEKALFSCDFSDTAPIIAYVSKMFAIPSDMLPENRRKQLTAEELREKGRAHRERLRALNGQSDESISEISSTTSNLTSTESLDESVEKTKVPSQTDEVVQPKSTKETFIGFARLYSGTIRVGQKLYVLGPKYDPAFPDKYCSEIIVENLYLMMGRELEALKEVPAGNVFGIGGLEGHILKNGTLSSTKDCKSLAGVTMESAPIVRVALEPADPSEMGKLTEGLRLLNQADPCVEVLVQETGEHVILTAGEVHLERCLRDLRERFAKIEIQVSPPIVPFRETIVPVSDNQPNKEKDNAQRGLVTLSTTNKYCTIKVRAVPLPPNVTSFLDKNTITIKSILDEPQHRNKIETQSIEDEEDTFKDVAFKGNSILETDEFLDQLEAEFNKASDKEIWKDVVDNIWAFGPKRVGPNLLINHVPNYKRKFSWRKYHQEVNEEVPPEDNSSHKHELSIRDFVEGIHTGFQLATKSGPLCAEPLMGVAYFLEDFTVNTYDENIDISEIRSKLGGQIITTMRDACNKGFLEWSSRLMLAMYSCDIQATTDTLGRVYGVISRRRGRITSEELKEGTTFFQIFALLPVVESFGFADEIRKRTSGAASPQLIFSGFEMLNEDPFWVPTTEEELEDLGEKSDRENLAKKYMESVRKRKGMFIDKKIVEHAEKQRTLKKK
ncbi:P-loop containing nucleoside triphosphate hydrolase protein [Rhizophagus clarus]|uniref:Ribosome assembly protein 1 n=1 Tax=Rhizophagus clarus TaxID=94130 RepID=A0A8H3LQE8_9GLOM|nr:P-loop containing nucleoside triphosphate hydrolase protein [Rhizophagus clarus]